MTRFDIVAVRSVTLRASGFTPFETRILEDAVQALRLGLGLDRVRPRNDPGRGDGGRNPAALDDGRRRAQVADPALDTGADEHFVDRRPQDRLTRREAAVLDRLPVRGPLVRRSLVGIRNPFADPDRVLGVDAPGDLWLHPGHVNRLLPMEHGVVVRGKGTPERQRLVPVARRGGELPPREVLVGRIVGTDHARRGGHLHREIADGKAGLLRQRPHDRTRVLHCIAGARVRAEPGDRSKDDVLRPDPGTERAHDVHAHGPRTAPDDRAGTQDVVRVLSAPGGQAHRPVGAGVAVTRAEHHARLAQPGLGADDVHDAESRIELAKGLGEAQIRHLPGELFVRLPAPSQRPVVVPVRGRGDGMVGYVVEDVGIPQLGAFLNQPHDLGGTPADTAVHLEQIGLAAEARDDVGIPDLVEHGPATFLRLESRKQGPGVSGDEKPGADRRSDEVTSVHGCPPLRSPTACGLVFRPPPATMIAVDTAKTGRRGAWTHRPLAWTVGGWQTPLQYRALGRATSVLARFQWVQPARRLFLSSLRRHQDHRRSVQAQVPGLERRLATGGTRDPPSSQRIEKRDQEAVDFVGLLLLDPVSGALDQVDAARFFTCPGDLSSPRPRRRSLHPPSSSIPGHHGALRPSTSGCHARARLDRPACRRSASP